MPRLLEITPEVKDALKKLVAKAAERPTTYEQAVAMSNSPNPADTFNDDNNDLTILIPHGYSVTYTEEYQRPDVRCRHMSITTTDGKAGTGPHPVAVQEVMRMMGFKNELTNCAVYVGTLHGRLCINVVEPVSGDMTELRK